MVRYLNQLRNIGTTFYKPNLTRISIALSKDDLEYSKFYFKIIIPRLNKIMKNYIATVTANMNYVLVSSNYILQTKISVQQKLLWYVYLSKY